MYLVLKLYIFGGAKEQIFYGIKKYLGIKKIIFLLFTNLKVIFRLQIIIK
jgi:hypothetical protein